MSGGTGFAFAALVCYGLSDFIYKRATAAGVKPHHFLMGQAWCFGPAIVLYGWASGTLSVRLAVLWSGLAGLFIFVAFYNFLRGLAAGSVSIVAPIFRLNFIVTAILAIVALHEPFKPAMLLALVAALAAIWLLLGESEHSKRAEITRRSLVAVLIATVTLGAANFFHTVGLRQGLTPETALASQAVVFVTLSTAFVQISDRTIVIPSVTWRHSAVAAVVLIGAFLFMLHGLTRGPASVLVPIAQMGFVVTATLGVALLDEPMTARKAAGLVAAVAALAVLAFG